MTTASDQLVAAANLTIGLANVASAIELLCGGNKFDIGMVGLAQYLWGSDTAIQNGLLSLAHIGAIGFAALAVLAFLAVEYRMLISVKTVRGHVAHAGLAGLVAYVVWSLVFCVRTHLSQEAYLWQAFAVRAPLGPDSVTGLSDNGFAMMCFMLSCLGITTLQQSAVLIAIIVSDERAPAYGASRWVCIGVAGLTCQTFANVVAADGINFPEYGVALLQMCWLPGLIGVVAYIPIARVDTTLSASTGTLAAVGSGWDSENPLTGSSDVE